MASSKKVGKMAEANVSKALAGISADTKLDMKDDTIKTATAPQKARSFGEAFRAARASGAKTFKWEGKPGTTFTTKMANDAPKRSAPASASKPAAPKPTAPKPSAPASTSKPAAATPKRTSPLMEAKIGSGKDQLLANIERRNKLIAPKSEPGFFARKMADISAHNKATLDTVRAAKAARDKAENERNSRPVGPQKADWSKALTKKYAKGGSVDGCAIRGKTRAPMKKGK